MRAPDRDLFLTLLAEVRQKYQLVVVGYVVIIHTNTVESAFSLIKRGIMGQYHKLSIKHLQRYLNEFQYRFNRREEPDGGFIETVRRLCGFAPLKFAALTSGEKA